MRLILTVIVILFGLVPMSACTHTEIHNGYKPTIYKIDESLELIFTVMHSTNDLVEGTTVYGEPYTLIVSVFLDQNIHSLSFHNMLMQSKPRGNEVALSEKEITTSVCVDDLECDTAITFDVGKIQYTPYTLSGLMTLNGDTHEFVVELETDYKKQRVNKFWVELMGI